METLKRLLSCRLSSDKFDGVAALLMCVVGAVATMFLGWHKLASLTLSEGEYFLGLLLVLVLGLLMVTFGMVVYLTALREAKTKAL